jgi:hypothetical protein
MNLQTQLKELSIDEKIIAMEILWKELSKNQHNIPSPKWHGQVLKQREVNETFIDWKDAKQEIKESI